MRTLVLANNRLGARVTRWLVEQGDELVGLVLHPEATRIEGGALIEAAGLPPEKMFCATRLREPETLERIRRLRPAIGLSVLFDTILKPELLDCFPHGVLNLHPSLLPWNRGQYPNVWSIVDGTPSGVTLHVIDATIDTGAIVAQRRVPVEPVDTGESLYRRLERAAFELFRDVWPSVREGRETRTPQDPAAGSCHRRRDVDRIDKIDLDRPTTARELIDLLRARTFPPYRGAWFEVDGRRVDLRLQLSWADDPESAS